MSSKLPINMLAHSGAENIYIQVKFKESSTQKKTQLNYTDKNLMKKQIFRPK